MSIRQTEAVKSAERLETSDVVQINGDPRVLVVSQKTEYGTVLEDSLGDRYLLDDGRIRPMYARKSNGRKVLEIEKLGEDED